MPPIFEYECDQCKKVYEHLHKYMEVVNVVCKQCNKPAKKVTSTPGFRLKGEWTSATKPQTDWD